MKDQKNNTSPLANEQIILLNTQLNRKDDECLKKNIEISELTSKCTKLEMELYRKQNEFSPSTEPQGHNSKNIDNKITETVNKQLKMEVKSLQERLDTLQKAFDQKVKYNIESDQRKIKDLKRELDHVNPSEDDKLQKIKTLKKLLKESEEDDVSNKKKIRSFERELRDLKSIKDKNLKKIKDLETDAELNLRKIEYYKISNSKKIKDMESEVKDMKNIQNGHLQKIKDLEGLLETNERSNLANNTIIKELEAEKITNLNAIQEWT